MTVIAARGSTPRHAGAHMLVGSDGSLLGSIGGGRVEQELVALAQEISATGGVRMTEHNLVQDLAMCCGGTMECFAQPLTPALPILEELMSRRRRRVASVLETDLTTGQMQVVEADGLTSAARDGQVFREPCLPAPRVLLFGCGHLARAIGPLASSLGLSLIHISEPTRRRDSSRMPSSA